MQKVFGFKGDGHALNRDIVVWPRVVAHIGSDGKGNRLGLDRGRANVIISGLHINEHKTRQNTKWQLMEEQNRRDDER